MVTSTSTSLPKTTIFVMFLFSTKLFPSPGAVIVSNALYISSFLKLTSYFYLILIAKIRLTLQKVKLEDCDYL